MYNLQFTTYKVLHINTFRANTATTDPLFQFLSVIKSETTAKNYY